LKSYFMGNPKEAFPFPPFSHLFLPPSAVTWEREMPARGLSLELWRTLVSMFHGGRPDTGDVVSVRRKDSPKDCLRSKQ
jgi:hypothetical protein